jgi:hypothetical protein
MAGSDVWESIGANIILIGGAAWAFVRFAIGLERKYGERAIATAADLEARLDKAEDEIDQLRDELQTEREAHFLDRLRCLQIENDLTALRARLGLETEHQEGAGDPPRGK